MPSLRPDVDAFPLLCISFFPDLDRLFDPGFIPTNQDILHCRGKTTGITETTFTVSELKYRCVMAGSGLLP